MNSKFERVLMRAAVRLVVWAIFTAITADPFTGATVAGAF